MNYRNILVPMLSVALAVGFADCASACSAVIVGKKVSATGRVIVAHNDDGKLSLVVRHGMVPAQKGTLGFFWTEFKEPAGGVTPGDTMLNECGVLVMSNNGGWNKTWCGCRGTLPDEGVYSSLADGGIGFELRRTIAEKAHSAREGLDIATNLLTKSGYNYPSRIFAISDKDEAWLLEVILGRRFVARRCPDDEVVAYPNCLTITGIKPGDVVSGNIEQKRDTFNFTAEYQGPRTWKSPYNLFRAKNLYKTVCGVELSEDGDYPFSMKPKAPVNESMIKAALTSHFEGTPNAVKPHPSREDELTGKITVPICRIGTKESIICSFADNVKDTIMEIATGRPCEVPYITCRPFGGVVPEDTVRGEEALNRLANRAKPL